MDWKEALEQAKAERDFAGAAGRAAAENEKRLEPHLPRLAEIAEFLLRVDAEMERLGWPHSAKKRKRRYVGIEVPELVRYDENGASRGMGVFIGLYNFRPPSVGFSLDRRPVPYEPEEVEGVEFGFPTDEEMTLEVVMRAVARWAVRARIELDLDG